jgi:hypothetical protein
MKKEQKEKIVAAAKKTFDQVEGLIVPQDAKVIVAPNGYWVQAWIEIPLDIVK